MHLLLFCVAVFAASSAFCAEPAKQYYRELGCLESKSSGNEVYNCSVLGELRKDKCFYEKKAYSINDVIKGDEVGNPCIHECMCQMGFATDSAKWECVNIECPELFMPPKKNCINTYNHSQCCAVDSVCSEDGKHPVTCEYEGKSYAEGQKFYPKKDSCKSCICKPGFNGTLTEPWCKTISCNMYLHYSSYIQDGCLPTYYFTDDCCPIPIWRCPQEDDSVITPKNAPVADENDDLKCKFGNVTLTKGQMLSPSSTDKCVECTCVVPPHPTCVMNTTCYAQK